MRFRAIAGIFAFFYLFFLLALPLFWITGGFFSREPKIALSDSDIALSVLMGNGSSETLSLDAWIEGVLYYYMKPDDSIEAYECMAVMARTFYWRAKHFEPRHLPYDVCESAGCCLGAAIATRREKANRSLSPIFGLEGIEKKSKSRQALESTDGIILVYSGEPIRVEFFQGGFGSTAGSKSAPYLPAVETPEGKTYCARFRFSMEEFLTLAKAFTQDSGLSYSDYKGISVERTPSGIPISLTIGSHELSASDVRKLCGLKSVFFEVRRYSKRICFDDYGIGGGIGLSLEGASVYGRSGMDCKAILAHYFPGTGLVRKND
ncbi:MAG: SpoIID/LytB domain-containing protein [Eubacteriaceae bacterium]|nr:SpoIID/LytB domain-containing protein [Eubacteriaceae bacterium]